MSPNLHSCALWDTAADPAVAGNVIRTLSFADEAQCLWRHLGRLVVVDAADDIQVRLPLRNIV